MAAISEFAGAVPALPPWQRERLRLGVAITLSVLLHLGLAAGMTVRAPGPVVSRSPAIIAVRLETANTALPEPQHPAPAIRHARGPESPPRALPADDGVQQSAVAQSSSSAAPVEKTPEARLAAAALPPVADPVYYPARQLDVYPALLQPVSLAYPRHNPNGNAEGRALLMLLIDETGVVRELSLIEAGPARDVEHSLRAAFSETRFSPARKDGRAVKSRVLISVDYRPGPPEDRP